MKMLFTKPDSIIRLDNAHTPDEIKKVEALEYHT